MPRPERFSWLPIIVLGFMVIFRGSFPVAYSLVAAGAALLLFMVTQLIHAGSDKPTTYGTYALGVLLAAYLVAIPGAANLDAALTGTLVLAGAAAVYWAGRRAFSGDRLSVLVFGIALISGIASLASLIALADPRIFPNMVDLSTGRLNGVFEYPNASGIFAAIGVLAAWLSGSERRWKSLPPILALLSVVCLFRTESLGSLGVFLAATVVLVLSRRMLSQVVTTLVGAALVYEASVSLVPIHLTTLVLAALGFGVGVFLSRSLRNVDRRVLKQGQSGIAFLLLAVLVAYPLVRLTRPLVVAPGRTYLTAVPRGVTAVRAAGTGKIMLDVMGQLPDETTVNAGQGTNFIRVHPIAGAVDDLLSISAASPVALSSVSDLARGSWHSVPFTLARLLPWALYRRYTGLLTSNYDVISRAYMLKDGLRMVEQRPIRGYGAGGWATAYSTMQSFPYVSSEPHDALLGIALDSGIPGLWAFMMLLLATGAAWFRRRKTMRDPSLLDGTALLAAMLFAHSFMDWDLSMPALLYVFFAFLGVLSGGEKEAKAPFLWRTPVYLSAAGAFLCTSLAIGQFYGASGDTLLAQKKALSALPAYQAATRFDPFSAEFRYDRAEIEEQLSIVNPKDGPLAYEDYSRATVLAPQAYLYRARRALFLARAGDSAAAQADFTQAITLAPMRSSLYSLAVPGDEWFGYDLLLHHKTALAKPYLENAVTLAVQMRRLSLAQPASPPPAFRLPETLPEVSISAGLAALFLHDDTLAKTLFPPLSERLSVPEAEALALGSTALARSEESPKWPLMAKVYAGRFPGFSQQLHTLMAALGS